MRFPVKLNRTFWPKMFTQTLPAAADPRALCHGKVDEKNFTEAVSTFKFGAIFKSTQQARFPLTILELASLQYKQRPIVVDIGASDGITSLDIMQAIPYEKYYVTDLNIDIFYQESGNATWFYDEKGICILMATDKWIVYPETAGSIFPFDKISQAFFARAPKWESDTARLRLINPMLQARKGDNLLIEKHNLLEPWPHEKANLIIAANILNKLYFTTSEIKQALMNMLAALDDSGYIAIIENRKKEQSTIFKFSAGSVSVEKRVNGGVEIESLALNSFG
jgi:hypothetical protein